MRPLIIDELEQDLFLYGRCTWGVTDNPDEFAVVRIDPAFDVYTLEV